MHVDNLLGCLHLNLAIILLNHWREHTLRHIEELNRMQGIKWSGLLLDVVVHCMRHAGQSKLWETARNNT